MCDAMRQSFQCNCMLPSKTAIAHSVSFDAKGSQKLAAWLGLALAESDSECSGLVGSAMPTEDRLVRRVVATWGHRHQHSKNHKTDEGSGLPRFMSLSVHFSQFRRSPANNYRTRALT